MTELPKIDWTKVAADQIACYAARRERAKPLFPDGIVPPWFNLNSPALDTPPEA